MGEIKSGEFGNLACVRDYRAERLGDVLVERVVWGEGAVRVQMGDTVLADPGYVWFRFWLPRFEQIVERYYSPSGVLIGTKVDVCTPLECDKSGCSTVDLLLDIWIDPEGRVTVVNEGGFEEAVRREMLSESEAERAEYHLRELTAAIARGRFPPPIVRNWQIDLRRINGESTA
jgi:uncharacterized protein